MLVLEPVPDLIEGFGVPTRDGHIDMFRARDAGIVEHGVHHLAPLPGIMVTCRAWHGRGYPPGSDGSDAIHGGSLELVVLT